MTRTGEKKMWRCEKHTAASGYHTTGIHDGRKDGYSDGRPFLNCLITNDGNVVRVMARG